VLALRQTLKIVEAAKVLGISRNAAYAAAKNGELPTVRIGRRLLVPKAALERLLGETGARPHSTKVARVV